MTQRRPRTAFCRLYGVDSKAELDDPPVRTDETTEETSESMDETIDEMGSSKPELELEIEIDAGSDELPDAADELIRSRGSRVVVPAALPLSLVGRDEDEGKSTMLNVTAVGAVEEADDVLSRTFDITTEGAASAERRSSLVLCAQYVLTLQAVFPAAKARCRPS